MKLDGRSRLILDLDLSADSPSGTVGASGQPGRGFLGWVGLLSALEIEVERLSGTTVSVLPTAEEADDAQD
jgi:hypothetical protein